MMEASSCAQSIEKAGGSLFVGAAGVKSLNPPWFMTGVLGFVINTTDAFQNCR